MTTHSHSFDGRWPFQEAESTLAICCEHVFSHAAPILYVRHEHHGTWQFLCGALHSDDEPRVVCLGCMVEKDATIWSLADMPSGWSADREHVSVSWNREAHPEPMEDLSDDA